MTGGSLLGLILISMAWLFFIAGLALNWKVFCLQLKRKEGERAASSLGFAPGVVGSLTVFFTIPALAKSGIDVPWPWLWIVLPLVLDPYCLGWMIWMVLGRRLR